MKNLSRLILLMDDCKAESVVSWFDFLEAGLGQATFHKLFEIGLTDNGSEFKKVEDLELSADKTLRTSMYYCDPMQSVQKGRLEKNHEYIRYVIPKSTSLNPYTQADMTVLINHINSTKRPGLGDKSPYEMITDDDEGMYKLMNLLDLHPIPEDQINLTKKLLNQ